MREYKNFKVIPASKMIAGTIVRGWDLKNNYINETFLERERDRVVTRENLSYARKQMGHYYVENHHAYKLTCLLSDIL